MDDPRVFDLRALPDLLNIGRIDGEYMAAGASFILEHNLGVSTQDAYRRARSGVDES